HVGLASVVVAGLDDDEAVPVDRLDQPMLVGEPARPLAGQVLTQVLGLADADSGVAPPKLARSAAFTRTVNS
ncbi:MAG: hypothetical protein ACOYO9_08570, partial [Candidatus Nanopelagicales bacterium]